MNNCDTVIRKKGKIIALLCTLVYFASYVMRINFAVMVVKICSDMNLEKSVLAVVITCCTVAYGIGQVVSGLLGDKFKQENLITLGVLMAAVCNILMFFSEEVWVMSVVWGINGFAHALLWPPMLKLFSTYLNDAEYSYAVVRVSWGSSVATVFLYLMCPLCLSFMSWRQIILSCAVIGIIILAVWLAVNPKVFTEPLVNTVNSLKSDKDTCEKIKLPKAIYIPIALIMLGIVFQGILRDGVTYWMPSFLLETFHLPEEHAIVCTVVLALFSVVSFAVFDFVHRRFFNNEVNCAAFIFTLAAVSSLILYFVNVNFSSVILSMLLMSVIVACMHGINLMLISIVPKYFAKVNKVSTFSGILNSCTYIGASLSSYGFALLADKFGWNVTIFSWIVVSVLGMVVCKLAVVFGWRKKFKKYLS